MRSELFGFRTIQIILAVLFCVGCMMGGYIRCLKKFYNRNGCLRTIPNDPENGRQGRSELRLVANNLVERREMLVALKAIGITHGRVYRKRGSQWVIPLYRRLDIFRFLEEVQPNGYDSLFRMVESAIRRRSQAEREYLEPPM